MKNSNANVPVRRVIYLHEDEDEESDDFHDPIESIENQNEEEEKKEVNNVNSRGLPQSRPMIARPIEE